MEAANPFPGMNPYIQQQRWRDFHARIIGYAADVLSGELPGDLRARMEERVWVERSEDSRYMSPDVHVYEHPWRRPGDGATAAGAAVAEPLVIHLPEVELTERYIEIIDVGSGGRIVTVIEFLSPSNKRPGRGRKLYLTKQAQTRDAEVNLVEVDLVLGGEPTTLVPPYAVPVPQRAPYHVSVYRAAKPNRVEYYALPLRQPLPIVPVPLRATDNDVRLNLQDLVNQCHLRGRYDDIDYTRPLDLPLPAEDADWARALPRR